MSAVEKIRIGDLLVEENLITEEQLQEALAVSKKTEGYKPLGEICVDLRFINGADLKGMLRKHQMRMNLGDLLVNLGLLNEDQLEDVLAEQKSTGNRVGQILIDKKLVTESHLIEALSIQLGVPKIAPDFNLIDESLLEGLSQSFLKKYEALPAFKTEGVLTVIMSDPLTEQTIVDLTKVFKCKIEPAIASSDEIQTAINQFFYKTESDSSDIVVKSKNVVIGGVNLSNETQNSIVTIVNYLVSNAIIKEASDIHIEPQESRIRIRYRIDGIMHHITDLPISMLNQLISRIKILCNLDISEKKRHQDGRIEAKIMDNEVDLRASTYVSHYGESIVIRILNRKTALIEIEALGFSPINLAKYKLMLDYPSGVILFAGPTGSGKSTTLYAALNYLNDYSKKIITVEDPVEYIMEGLVQGQLNKALELTYADFLKSMMRQDPDVLMIGEIRDEVAAQAAIEASLTGHKVLTTFRTDDTTGALLRLMDMGVESFMISSIMVSVVSQRLVRRLCSHCKKPIEPEQKTIDSFYIKDIDPSKFTFYGPVGCLDCNDIGYKGRIAIHELLVVNDAVRDALLTRQSSSIVRSIARSTAHMLSMREDGFYKVTQGITSLDEILRAAFSNESDTRNAFTVDNLMEVCEQGEEEAYRQLYGFNDADDPEEGKITGIATISAGPSSQEKEVYRVRLACDNVETQQEPIRDLFQEYQKAMSRAGHDLDTNFIKEFSSIIINKVKVLKATRGPEFVELSIKENNSRVRLLLKALIPSKDAPTPAFTGRRAGSHLFESLGMEIGGSMGKGGGIDPLLSAESGLYQKHEEEIDLVNNKGKIIK